MVAFCKGIQAAAPVDSYVDPIPWAMPGYDSEVIMAGILMSLQKLVDAGLVTLDQLEEK